MYKEIAEFLIFNCKLERFKIIDLMNLHFLLNEKDLIDDASK
jgi:hypothetical protein